MKPEKYYSRFFIYTSTGIWPGNREKYPLQHFDSRILSKYYEWTESSKPALNGNNVNGPFHHELTNTSSESLPKPLTPVTNV